MRKYILMATFMAVFVFGVSGQETNTANQNLLHDYQLYQKLNRSVYDTKSKFHSSIRGFYSDDAKLKTAYDSLMNVGIDSLNQRSWVHRKLFQEHLIQFKNEEYSIYADLLGDFQIGKDFKGDRNTWLNTRGFQVGGNVGEKFSFYLNGFENQGKFADYVNDYIVSNQVVPGDRKSVV